MKRGRLLKPVLWLTAACIILPAIVLLIWCFAARWPWPGILPESLSLRTVKELIFGSAKLPKLLLSSISLSFAVAAISTTIGIATARATELYEFRGKGLIRFFSLLPLLVPGTVLAIGAQIMLLKVGLGDSIAGIILIHTVASVPYCITIMTDVTAALGDKFEEQAATLGAGPFRAFFEVTLPNLMPGIMSSFSMGFIISYSQYFTTLIIGGGNRIIVYAVGSILLLFKYRLVWLFHAHEVISSVLRRPEGNVCALQRVKSALEMGGRYFGYVAAYEHAFAVAHREN